VLGCALVGLGRTAEAEAPLQRAIDHLARLEPTPALAEARELLRQARLNRDKVQPADGGTDSGYRQDEDVASRSRVAARSSSAADTSGRIRHENKPVVGSAQATSAR
jgi:hypothetical protein